MNLLRPKRWQSKRARRGLGWIMLLTVLALCMVTLSRGGRAAPPPLTGPTVGDLMQKAQSSSLSSPSSPQETPRSRHPMKISLGDGGISIDTRADGDGREVPSMAASPEASATPDVLASPEPTPEVAASPTPEAVPSAVPTPEVAATPWEPNAEGGGNSSIFINKLQQMVIMLFLIGFLAFACLKMMQRHLPGMAGGGKRVKQLEVLERQALATGATVSLVRVGKKYLVLGQTEQNVNTLCELTPDQLEELPAEKKGVPAPPAVSMSFHGDILRHYLSIIPGFRSGSKGGV